jgi:hypothetical protein
MFAIIAADRFSFDVPASAIDPLSMLTFSSHVNLFDVALKAS